MGINQAISDKYDQLKRQLGGLPALAVAFSGGVDSSLLLAAAVDVLGQRVVALTADSVLHPSREIQAAVAIAGRLNVRQRIIRTDEMDDPDFRANTRDRCYICKKMIFSRLMSEAVAMGIDRMAHGVNMDDFDDYRPGLRAASEMEILAPLADARLTKAEIRLLARERGLPNWNRPAMACLASRIPYGTELSPLLLARVEAAENLVADMGFLGGRVRCHGDVARIELAGPDDMARALADHHRRRLVEGLQSIGFRYVALDMEGYRQGSLNAALSDDSSGR